MPYIQAKVSFTLEDDKKYNLQEKLTNIVSASFSKPIQYIMSEIEDNSSLYMAGKKAEKSAYISVSLLGSAAKDNCYSATQQICDLLSSEYGIDGSNVYITFHPESLWGWNGMMF